MSPSTGVLHWMARHARQLGIMVRQVEDELGVINMAIGAAHTGCRAMCATSGGGFALMTEALGAASMMEVPLVCINVQRAGPATGVPTKTEQGDLWQVLGAGQGDYPRLIVAPTTILDCFKIVPELFNLADKFQCPGIILSDLLISEGRVQRRPGRARLQRADRSRRGHRPQRPQRPQHRGAGRLQALRPHRQRHFAARPARARPGYVHVVATDEHDDDGGLISDEFTNPHQAARDAREAHAQDGRRAALDRAAGAVRPGRGRRHAARLGLDRRRHSRGDEQAARRREHRRQQPAGQVARPAARGCDPERAQQQQARHHRREQLQRPVRALSALGNELRSRWPHPQVRRRAVHAAPHRRRRQGKSSAERQVSTCRPTRSWSRGGRDTCS